MDASDQDTRSFAGDDDRPKPPSQYQLLWRGSTLGLELVGSILISGFVGWLLDQWWNTTPWMLLTLGAVGVLAGGWNFLKDARSFAAQASASDRRRRTDNATSTPPGPALGGAPGWFEREEHDVLPEDDEDHVRQWNGDAGRLGDTNGPTADGGEERRHE